jgi:hypothetical protein
MGDLSYNSSTHELVSNVNGTNLYNNFLNFAVKSGIKIEHMPIESQVLSLFTLGTNNRFFVLMGLKGETYSGSQRLRLILGPSVFNFYNDSGAVMPLWGINPSTTNRSFGVGNVLSGIGTIDSISIGYSINSNLNSFNFAGVSSGNSFGLLHSQFNSSPPVSVPIRRNNILVWYVGALQDHNSSYLGNSFINRQLCINSCISQAQIPTSNALYSVAPDSGSESYIVGGKILTPGGVEKIETNLGSIAYYQGLGLGQWATDYMVYGESGNFLGRAPNLKIANGYILPHRPISLQSYSEAGYNCWLPIGKIGPYTLLMRCYSSTIGSGAITDVSLDSSDEILYPRFCNANTSLWN